MVGVGDADVRIGACIHARRLRVLVPERLAASVAKGGIWLGTGGTADSTCRGGIEREARRSDDGDLTGATRRIKRAGRRGRWWCRRWCR